MLPDCTSQSVRSFSICLRVRVQSEMSTIFTVCPLRASNSLSAKSPVTFLLVRSMRRSGLSEP